eukprot:gene33375-38784_t
MVLFFNHHLDGSVDPLAVHSVLADVLDQNPTFCKDKIVLEIGAGAALPSLVASALGARSIVITDYPEISVLENISELITRNKLVNCQVLGYKWGED